MDTFHSISWGQHIEEEKIFTKTEHKEAILKYYFAPEQYSLLCKKSKVDSLHLT